MSYSETRIKQIQDLYGATFKKYTPDELVVLYVRARGKYNSQYQNFAAQLHLPILNKEDFQYVASKYFDIEAAHCEFLKSRNPDFGAERNTNSHYSRRQTSINLFINNCNLFCLKPASDTISWLKWQGDFRNALVSLEDPWGKVYQYPIGNRSKLGVSGCCPSTLVNPRHKSLDTHAGFVSELEHCLGSGFTHIEADLISRETKTIIFCRSAELLEVEGKKGLLKKVSHWIRSEGYRVIVLFYEEDQRLTEQYRILRETLIQNLSIKHSFYVLPTWKSAKVTRFYPSRISERLMFVDA